MPHDVPLITTLAAGFGLALILGFAAARLRLPPLLGYLLAGVIIGPGTPGFVADVALAGQLAEIGVMLLMFGVGLHFSLADLLAVPENDGAGGVSAKQASSEILRLAGALYCSAVCNRCIFYTDRWSFCFAAPADFALCPFQSPAGCGVVWHKILEVWQR